jgi:hypothetical protein
MGKCKRCIPLDKIQILIDYSMIQPNVEAESYSMHSVVHEWLGWSIEHDKSELARIAIITVAFATPVDDEDGYWLQQKRLLPHANHLMKYMAGKDRVPIAAVPMSETRPDSLPLDPTTTERLQLEHPLRRISWLYFQQRLFDDGKSIIETALAQFQQEVGMDHPLTLRSISILAIFDIEIGQYRDAEELSQLALSGFDKLFGANNKF